MDRRAQFAAERAARHAARDAARRAQRSARRRRQLRRVAPIVAVASVLLGAVATGSVLAGRHDPAPTARPAGGAPLGSQTIANGPLPTEHGTGLLALQLSGTTDAFAVDFAKPPKAGLVFDLDSGRVFWRRHEARPLPIASVTKMMTALVVVDLLGPSEKIKIDARALRYSGSGVGVLPKGKKVGVSALLHGLLLASGNDAAKALAIGAAGTEQAFVRQMNLRAAEMGLSCTKFSSPSGIIDYGNQSCAADLAVLSRALLDEPRLAKIVGRRSAVLPFPIKGGKLWLYNHNPLLKEGYAGTIGIKTGYTDAAGKTFVAAVRRDGKRYGVVLLGTPDMAKQSKQLLARAYQAAK